jgi:hypothetical protein
VIKQDGECFIASHLEELSPYGPRDIRKPSISITGTPVSEHDDEKDCETGIFKDRYRAT